MLPTPRAMPAPLAGFWVFNSGGRALPYEQSKMDYYRYEVVKEFTVKAGEAVPWFDQPGGEPQYMTEKPVRQLIIDGYLKEVGKVERDRQ